jgi:hypothetical protein
MAVRKVTARLLKRYFFISATLINRFYKPSTSKVVSSVGSVRKYYLLKQLLMTAVNLAP